MGRATPFSSKHDAGWQVAPVLTGTGARITACVRQSVNRSERRASAAREREDVV